MMDIEGSDQGEIMNRSRGRLVVAVQVALFVVVLAGIVVAMALWMDPLSGGRPPRSTP